MPGYFQADRDVAQAFLPKHGKKFSELEAYIFLTTFAAFAPRVESVGSKLISLKVGELVASERYLCSRWGWSRTKVRNFKESLKKNNLLDQREDQQETILTIGFTRVEQFVETNKKTTDQTKVGPEENHQAYQYNKKEKGIKNTLSVENLNGGSALLAENHVPARGGDLQFLMKQVNGLRPEWQKPATWNYQDQRELADGVAQQLQELDSDDWEGLKIYLNTPLNNPDFWQPRNRSKFCQTFADVFTSYQNWKSNKQTSTPQKQYAREL